MPTSKKTTVYAVERGSYSDYAIEVIFSTKKAAEQAIKSMERKYGDERVVGWTVHVEVPPKQTLYVKESYGGKVTERSNVYDGWDDAAHTFVGRFTRGLGFDKWSNGSGNHYRFWGFDKARVHKAFDDYHAQRRAEAEGIT